MAPHRRAARQLQRSVRLIRAQMVHVHPYASNARQCVGDSQTRIERPDERLFVRTPLEADAAHQILAVAGTNREGESVGVPVTDEPQ